MFNKSLATAFICVSSLGIASFDAGASVRHSRCDGGFKQANGIWVSDPVCNANLAASISRKNGFNYSAAELYHNPATLNEACRGEKNIELTTVCAPYND